jgi:hypothetical protein
MFRNELDRRTPWEGSKVSADPVLATLADLLTGDDKMQLLPLER